MQMSMQTMVIAGPESRVLARAAAKGFRRWCMARRAATEAPAAPLERPGLAELVRGYLASHSEATIREIAEACNFSPGQRKSVQITIRRYKDVERCGERRGGGPRKEVLWRLKSGQRIAGAD